MAISSDLKEAIDSYLQQSKQKQGDLAALCRQVPNNFSSWLNGKRLGPSPRTPSGLAFYEKLAEVIKWPVGKVIAHAEANANMDTSKFWEGFNKQAQKALTTSSELSPETRKKVLLIALNSHGCEEYLDVILTGFQTYIEKVCHLDWIENPSQVQSRLAKKRGK
ncbi:hypothetical protein WDW86_02060 [Bdellovibrionota bacterium FG-2]